jgi:hypothetical protein
LIKLHKKKAPKKVKEKETRGKDQSQGKQKVPKEAGHAEKREPLNIKTLVSCMKHIN